MPLSPIARVFALTVILSASISSSIPLAFAAPAKAGSGEAQKKKSDVAQTPVAFVQSFYNWYGGIAIKDESANMLELAVAKKASSFAPPLLKSLKEDLAAQAKAEGEIVGLDFDPVLSINGDPAQKYSAKPAKSPAGKTMVDVFETRGGKTSTKPVVSVELAKSGGSWAISNIHYGKSDIPENENLVSILKVLKDSRDNPAAE